jgi:DinB family protein
LSKLFSSQRIQGLYHKGIMKNDKALRKHILYLLEEGGAHLDFNAAVKDMPFELQGKKPKGGEHSAWQLLEHLRITLWDIVEFSRDPKHVSPKWPEAYWPATAAPPDEKSWSKSAAGYRAHLKVLTDLVANEKVDLFARIPHGDGQTILREALLAADHTAYHLGQLVEVRRALGAWK